ncbi:hypothetical protein KSC_084510 [Ktedonobacter sp. SOSP1-52]|uniref:GAF domain-containing protein n=1 Tax=Ktedonobacter sp. SOSP1-52 TaxID=2778366 RepID=UPI0019156D87|nr:GAF domain-containing protein [Ktedonobacter sp. SOSP1-52]GHO69559.1 hypothetical protein KSC_084510 [Ktedonobacter sp. SOSP1-52]
MTQETSTWRGLLGQIISDAQERQRIADLLRVNPITLTRWAKARSKPRAESLRQLIDVLPTQRQQLIELITSEYPHLFAEEEAWQEDIAPLIPSNFYTRVLNIHTTSSLFLRSSAICIAILQQILAHLDPTQNGMEVCIAQCVPSQSPVILSDVQQPRIHSLRTTFGRGTPPWNNHENQTVFFGAESLIGQAALRGHYIAIQTRDERQRLFPAHATALEESIIGLPIVRADRVAGVLSIASTQPHFFASTCLDLAIHYAELLTLAFESHEFYRIQDLDLGLLPPIQRQQSSIANFQLQVTQTMIQAQQQGEPLTRPVAELRTWQEIESRLLHQAWEEA